MASFLSKQNIICASLAIVIGVPLVICVHNSVQDLNDSVAQLMRSKQQKSNVKVIDQSDKMQNASIELASNNRMASVVSFVFNANAISPSEALSFSSTNDYLPNLATQFKNDFIDDNLYARLAAQGSNVEFRDLGDNLRIYRNKFYSKVEPGSHFDEYNKFRLILPNETIDFPTCDSKKTIPYVAYMVAYANKNDIGKYDVKISEELKYSPVYRLSLKDAATNNVDYLNYKDRILVDVGCATK